MKTSSIFLAGMVFLALALSGCNQDPTVTVNIYAHDERGNPVADAYVNAYSNYSLGSGINDRWTNINGSLISSVKTGSNGYATVQIIPGNYGFRASKNGYMDGGAEKLIITGSNNIDITLTSEQSTWKLGIEVADYETGELVNLPIQVKGTVCPASPNGSCQRVDTTMSTNPLSSQFGKETIGVKFDLTFSKDGYEDAAWQYTLDGADVYAQIKMKKIVIDTNEGTGPKWKMELKVVDYATGGLVGPSVAYSGTICTSVGGCQSGNGNMANPYTETFGADMVGTTYDLNFFMDGYEPANWKYTVQAADINDEIKMKKKASGMVSGSGTGTPTELVVVPT